MSPIKYIQEAVRNFHLAANLCGRFRLPENAENPFKIGYDSELDCNPKLEPVAASYFQIVIGILRWMTELGILI